MTAKTAIQTHGNENKQLTERLIASLQSRPKEYFVRDTTIKGFYVRVKASGHRSYGVNARRGGKGKFIQRVIGDVQRFSLKEAREKGIDWLRLISEGKDPKIHSEKKTSPVDLLEQYLALNQLSPITVAHYRYLFTTYLRSLGSKPSDEITPDEIVSWYQKGSQQHATATDRTFVTLKTVMHFGHTLGLLKQNPAGIAGQVIQRPKTARKDTHLREIFRNLKPFVNAFIATPLRPVMRDWLVLVLTTGLRKVESMTLKWDQVDFSDKSITIPINKANRLLVIPMIPLTYSMLQSRQKDDGKHPVYVFNSTNSDGCIRDGRKAIHRICAQAEITDYSTHDLRRLFASVCEQLDYSIADISRLLNHASPNVTDRYVNRSIDRVRKMYQDVADYLDQQVDFPEPDPDDKVSSMVECATGVMRYNFYNAGDIYPYFTSKAEKEREQYYEDTYWEG